MAYYLGIDVGTSSVKLTCIDGTGAVVASASEVYEIDEPRPGWREMDPEAWWKATCSASAKLSECVGYSQLAGIGVTGQMHTVVFIDAEGRSTAPAIMWNDQRTIDSVTPHKAWARQEGLVHLESLVATGIPALSIEWFAQNEPDAFERTATFITVPDWIGLRLGGRPGMDYCGASTSGLYDSENLDWSKKACDHFGMPASKLPTVEKSDEVIGFVSSVAAAEMRIPQGVPIVRGTGDNPAASLCTGCLVDGCPTVSLGTSGVLMYARDGVYFPTAGKPVLFSWKENLKTLVQLSARTCGGAKEWLYGKLLRTDSYDIEDKEVEDPLYDMRGIMFYPHLAGEKVLHADPAIRGAFIGLDMDTTRSELQRALMEGTSFALKSLMDAVEGSDDWDEIRLVGGGSKNDFWSQALCSILGKRVARAKTSGAGHGAALLALSAVEGKLLEELALHAYEHVDSLRVNEEAAKIYVGRYARYKRMYDALASLN